MDDFDDELGDVLEEIDFVEEFLDPPVNEGRVLWERANPLVNLSDFLFR